MEQLERIEKLIEKQNDSFSQMREDFAAHKQDIIHMQNKFNELSNNIYDLTNLKDGAFSKRPEHWECPAKTLMEQIKSVKTRVKYIYYVIIPMIASVIFQYFK